MRKRFFFNDGWRYAAERLPLNTPDDQFAPITLPHTNKIFPWHNFPNSAYQFISTYRKRFTIPDSPDDSLVFLDFDGVMLACEVYLNGGLVGEHLGGFTSFSMDITAAIMPGENVLTVYVDSRERKDIPPFGHLVDYLTFGGIYRDVTLRIVHPIHIENVCIKTADVLSHPRCTCEVILSGVKPNLNLSAILKDHQGRKIAAAQIPVNQNPAQVEFDTLPNIKLWSTEQPNLYTAQISLIQDGNLIDAESSRFGFRAAEFREDGGFYLNGERIQLFGLNRHQTYPYIGAAAPARLQRQDADILKTELACNIVRTAHYPQSPYFLDRCDEIGLLVFEEIAGWQHIGDENWRQISLDELGTMIKRDRNHPAIILWGVRINESGDHDDFYTQTNALAHALDPTRQTGGVRCFLGSSFLEDVYTYNDFSNTVLEPAEQPYLITEFAGHMFPTKTWDNEERRMEHALLHARIQDLQMGNPRIAGAIGWCAFDYATHPEFGSGDGICYHGVMDIFRQPKWAAYFYMSQLPPSQKVVLQAATQWTMGERAGGGNNPLTIFSNCDEIEVQVGDNVVGRFRPDHGNYPTLVHPPFTIPIGEEFSAWGQAGLGDLYLIGFLHEEQAAEQWIACSQSPVKLDLSADVQELNADGSDMTRLSIRITDAYGNPLPYAFKIVTLKIDGPAELIGENPLLLVGGQAAVYIKAHHQTGLVTIHAKTSDLPETEVTLKLISPE